MTGRKKFSDLKKGWSKERKLRVATKTLKMDHELDLASLRARLDLSQVELADRLGRSQGAISQLEKRNDMTLSNLHRVIEAMGGSLKILAEFPDETVPLGFNFENE